MKAGRNSSPRPAPIRAAKRQANGPAEASGRGVERGLWRGGGGMPGSQLGQSRAGHLDLEHDRDVQLGLDPKAVNVAADGPLQAKGDLAARKAAGNAGLRPGSWEDGLQGQPPIDRVVFQAPQV